MDAYRAGYNKMWDCAAPYMRRKGFKRPGEFRTDNQHGGNLWATRKECQMTDRTAGEIIEKVYLSRKATESQLKQVRHSLSYSYYLQTGIGGDNWPEVKSQWRSFALRTLPETKRKLKPVRIPTPLNLKAGLLKQWTMDCGLSLAMFIVGLLATWHFHVFGLRPNVDIKKVKGSKEHDLNLNEGYGKTKMVNGRSKLHLSKRGTREWWVYVVCTCKGKKHKVIPKRELFMNKDGNPRRKPTWNTTCPLSAMQFLKHHQGTSDWRPYPKWTKRGNYGTSNVGDVPLFANKWLQAQGQHADEEKGKFDRNSGRKSLARWLEELSIPYADSVPIHGDLEDVWRGSYQDRLHKSSYRCREQPTDPDAATKALRLFARWLHQDGNPEPSLKEKLKALVKDLD